MGGRDWYSAGSSSYADHFRHGYDRNSNRLWRENTLAVGYDELYAYDGLKRLVDMDRGTLNAQRDGITSATFAQGWGLDPLGNWAGFDEDADGDGANDLAQSRTHSDANEITDIGETAGASWATPGHNRAGNMTTMPKPEIPAEGFTAVYDAWNRLVRLEDGAATVARYEYDGRGRRITKKTYASGVLDETRHFYYTSGWQVIEERVGTSPETADAERQYVWGVRYVDALIQRKRDTTSGGGDGTLDETLYALQDANYNVTSIVDSSGSVVERNSYTPYGQRTILTAGFSTRSSSAYAWNIGHQGLMHDAESGLVYNRNRMLHPVLGRFVQRDPLGYVDGLSLYEYVLSSPVDRIDPSGNAVVTGTAAATYVAASFGLSVAACLSNPECRQAVEDATRDAVTDLTNRAVDAFNGHTALPVAHIIQLPHGSLPINMAVERMPVMAKLIISLVS